MLKTLSLTFLGFASAVTILGYRFAFMPEEEWGDFVNNIDDIRARRK